MCFLNLKLRTVLVIIAIVLAVESVYIDDSIHHSIQYHNFAEAANPEELLKYFDSPTDDFVSIRSANDERYVCQLPENIEEKIAPTDVYNGPSPAELLVPLVQSKECALRQEPYWFYELCHGRYILQYHDDKAAKKRTEFYLGNFKQDYISIGTSKIEQMNPPKRLFENEERAYYNVSFTQGTYCDLIGGHRSASVLYMCSEEHKHYFYSFMEISSCRYEIVVLTNRLCSHPAYKPKPKKNKQIHCYNVDEQAPAKPVAFEELEKSHEATFKNEYVVKVLTEVDPELLKEAVKDIFQSLGVVQRYRLVGDKRPGWNLPEPFPNKEMLQQTIDQILPGTDCIEADQGWWQFEICYGKTIKQVHYENEQKAQVILLGRFDSAVHKAWVDEAPDLRRPKVFDDKVMQVSHLYSQGDICHENNGHRSVEMRIRCKQVQQNLGAVTLNIEEPSLCQYIITLESDRFCEPMQYADDYGIITVEPVDDGPSIMIGIPPTEDSESSTPSSPTVDDDNTPPL